ncbi:MAG: DUF3429 domain-containing protein [Gammaproteobacteria bacterium]|nr:DUF3429 domain-containing protein [Gammaproteobacteria bacterium]MDD9897023.1 DUF3429 domain-containing protein [Gammaproteobacteria bacterium]MDD9959743.1 DUF3429 domain-containing protein [Gammaproteobacteria bacterium]
MLTKAFLVPTLGYLGLIPFLGAAALALSGQLLLGLEPELMFVGYSAVILAFLCGSLWGKGLGIVDSPASRTLLVVSNLFAVLAWVSLTIESIDYGAALTALGIGYSLILYLEYRMSRILFANIEYPYLALRVRLTAIVLCSHLGMAYLSL